MAVHQDPLRRILLALLWILLLCGTAFTTDLEGKLSRNEVQIYSAPIPAPVGRTVLESGLVDRLERRGYQRVHSKPVEPGQFFFGNTNFWIYRKAHWVGSDERPARLFGYVVGSDGVIRSAQDSHGNPIGVKYAWLEPMLLSESLQGRRADRVPVNLDELPEHVWRAVLAIEDQRFFEHRGIDGKAVSRALLKNAKKGEVTEGGSTITQQLIKNRDLSPKRSLGRKADEAVRALALESEFSKEEILQAYLNSVYMGDVHGVEIYGFGAAARTYFRIPANQLDVARAASLAALIQAPNRFHPFRHPYPLFQRRILVIDRMEELGWIDSSTAAAARRPTYLGHGRSPRLRSATAFIRWTGEIAEEEAPRRHAKHRGFIVESSLDPQLQDAAEIAVSGALRPFRRYRYGLQAALIALDITTGDVLAHVAYDPIQYSSFDRVRSARRQLGSAVKPFLLLEAFQSCGRKKRLHPATRILDAPVAVTLPSGDWSPDNSDGRSRRVVEVRDAFTSSLDTPFVHISQHCGPASVADRFEKAGLELPDQPPTYTALGSIETTPLDLARAYTVMATPGTAVRPRPVRRLSTPGGRTIRNFGVKTQRVAHEAPAFLVGWLMEQAVVEGTARDVAIPGLQVAAITGISSQGGDAWLAGYSGSVLAVVWVGRDDGGPTSLSGDRIAATIWREFMETAALARPARSTPQPARIREAYVDPETGLRVGASKDGARSCLFKKGDWPLEDRAILRDAPIVPIGAARELP